jgi:hypothetical protein
MPLIDYINLHYDGNRTRFAEAQGVKPQQVTQWIKNGFIVVDGALYSHRRTLKG